ncbi:MAG TPA: PIN domain-containing protein [Thermoanaerobaculia bacterium]|nr:PIN domain-containing protein [Thermoanaerobaculia bacterium]
MIVAVDTSAVARAFAGHRDPATLLLRQTLSEGRARFAPIVVMELLSNPGLTAGTRRFVRMLPRLDFRDGVWERAGMLRADIAALGLKANVPDCVIAQTAIDHGIPLITYDRDFRHFQRAGLQLL